MIKKINCSYLFRIIIIYYTILLNIIILKYLFIYYLLFIIYYLLFIIYYLLMKKNFLKFKLKLHFSKTNAFYPAQIFGVFLKKQKKLSGKRGKGSGKEKKS